MRRLAIRIWYSLRGAFGEARMWLDLGGELAALGPTPKARRRIRRVAAWLPMRDAVRLLSPRSHQVTLALGAFVVDWSLTRRTDLAVAREVLLENEYADVPVAAPVEVVLDLGSHIGFSVLFFYSAYPGARIIAVEPDPGTARSLRGNLASLPGVELHEVAVTSTDGPVDFRPAVQAWTSSLRDRGDGARTVQVRGQSLDSLLAELGLGSVDLLKIDVEGAELAVLGASKRLEDIRAIVGELHDPGDLAELRELLSGFDVDVRNVAADHMAFSAVRRDPDGRTTR